MFGSLRRNELKEIYRIYNRVASMVMSVKDVMKYDIYLRGIV